MTNHDEIQSAMNHEMTAEMAAVKTRMQSFVNDEVIPQEPVLLAEDEQAAQVMAALKERARELGLAPGPAGRHSPLGFGTADTQQHVQQLGLNHRLRHAADDLELLALLGVTRLDGRRL